MELWHFIQSKLSEKKSVYLMCVMQHRGSSPGRQGFKMAIAADGDISGSIGGGIMEYNLAEYCKGLLGAQKYISFVKHQIHKGTITNGSGMICSGEQTVLFYPLKPEHKPTIDLLVRSLSRGEAGVLALTQDNFKFEEGIEQSTIFDYSHENDSNWYYRERLNFRETVYIVGGGHVGLATSKLLNQLGYFVVLFDNRQQLNTFESNSFVNEKKLVDYKQITSHITNPEAIILIMTNKYTDDKLVLSQCIRLPHLFLGVLGSSAKLEVMFDVLGKEGFTKEELNKIHAPIGLPIRSQTPDEIAVSIAAQLISLRTLIRKTN